MIFKSLFKNPLDGKTPWRPYYGYLILAVIIVSGCLYVYQRLNGGPVIPTSAVPAVEYQIAKTALEQQNETIVAQEVEPVIEPASPTAVALDATAKATVALLNKNQAQSATANLALPFTSQAPFGNWDALHEDTCEEASILMVERYFAGVSGNLDQQTADDSMIDMVDTQTALGLFTSLTASELATFTESYFVNLEATVIEDPSIDEIKAYIDAGIPVLVPSAGRELGNPFFSGEGPLYHYLVIRGYDDDIFITNDPGTRHGENYTYKQSIIMDAMGDWNDGDPAKGAKRILILEPKT